MPSYEDLIGRKQYEDHPAKILTRFINLRKQVKKNKPGLPIANNDKNVILIHPFFHFRFDPFKCTGVVLSTPEEIQQLQDKLGSSSEEYFKFLYDKISEHLKKKALPTSRFKVSVDELHLPSAENIYCQFFQIKIACTGNYTIAEKAHFIAHMLVIFDNSCCFVDDAFNIKDWTIGKATIIFRDRMNRRHQNRPIPKLSS